MRPLHLTFSGLRSYPGPTQTLDFTGKWLVAILGDTGAGKTTILEAITLALYGASSWSNRVKELIAEGATAMTVDLTFSHQDHTWRVRRVYYANTRPSSHLLQNLDTGEDIDDSRAVNRRIEHLLKLKRDEFQAAVLLPQGHFDRLLTATDTERTELLKGIFGTRFLETARSRAERQRDTIRDLLHQAQLTRGGYLDHPRTSADHATAAARAAQDLADRLSAALSQMHQLQGEARRQASRLHDLDGAIGQLSDPADRPDTGLLNTVAQAEQELGEAAQRLIRRHQNARAQHAHAQERLNETAGQGITAEAIAGACAVLADLPNRQTTLAQAEARLKAEHQHLRDEHRQLEEMAADVARLHEQAEQMTTQADADREHVDRITAAAQACESATRAALASAVAAAQADAVKTAALTAHHTAQAKLPALRAAHLNALTAVRVAAQQLDAARQAEAAHVAGQGLHPGDSCTVCTQRLPVGYQPPAPIDPIRLHDLEQQHSAAQETLNHTVDDLRAGESDATAAEQALTTATEQHTSASNRLTDRLAAAVTAAACPDLAAPPPADTASRHDPEAFARDIHHTADRVLRDTNANPTGTDTETGTAIDGLPLQLSEPLCAPAHLLAQSYAAAATAATRNAHIAAAEAAGAAKILTARKSAHTIRTQAHREARDGHTNAVETLHETLQRLPAAVRAVLPVEPSALTRDHISAAAQECERLNAQVKQAQAELEQAATTLAATHAERMGLVHRREVEIKAPLTALLTAATACFGTLHRAHALLDGDPAPISVPTPAPTPAPGQVSLPAVRDLCDQLTATRTTLERQLRADRDKTVGERAATRAALDLAARRIPNGDPTGDPTDDQAPPLVTFPADIPLSDPQALAPLSEAIGAARHTHAQQANLARRAQAQIEPAERLDRAIGCAASRLETLNLLHRQLADGKFLTYLTERRTRALLILASQLFARLTSGRYGFTDDFRIVSLATRTTRSAKTLSGGETFLASLALALALVELHSRNGARLGSLFLDEGFGALDANALASALSVLRAESGGDKLVTVISHLHAVAEAVDDVLWINRTAAGSEARWLTNTQRDALIYDHAQSGLLSLADQGS